MLRFDNNTDTNKLFQKDTACTGLECCRNMHNLCPHNPFPQRGGPDSVFWGPVCHRSLRLAQLLTKVGGGESNPGPTTHTNKHSPALPPVIWTCDLSHKLKQTTNLKRMSPHTPGSSEMHNAHRQD